MQNVGSGKLLLSEKMSSITSEAKARFRRLVWNFYRRQGRHELPWRKTADPYLILVSEVMLQQTQVDRVIPKYEAFIDRFPSVDVLAAAPLRDVLELWSGLGYNRRARYLHETAIRVVTDFQGVFPHTVADLLTLPGVGSYTARAIGVFAFGLRSAFIETNVRTVYLHQFFPEAQDIPDSALMPLIEQTLPPRLVRDWYYALMDYGVYLKKTQGNANRRSRHYVRQKAFTGSHRQLRGRIVKLLLDKRSTELLLRTELNEFSPDQIRKALTELVAEQLIRKVGRQFEIT